MICSYFEHNERTHTRKIVAYELVEFDAPTDKGMTVVEERISQAQFTRLFNQTYGLRAVFQEPTPCFIPSSVKTASVLRANAALYPPHR